jgi:hypothetical protein
VQCPRFTAGLNVPPMFAINTVTKPLTHFTLHPSPKLAMDEKRFFG